ncbi:MAG TPA: HAMP domain-containing sensor histidine kinase [Clostridia bacterium]|nr:HAMP domain-containing sensor histidine kinase [Clostridia bacterium]
MFNRLRNRFLILNMAIISITMFISFASIYFITYKNVNNEINMNLRRISGFGREALLPLLPQIKSSLAGGGTSGPLPSEAGKTAGPDFSIIQPGQNYPDQGSTGQQPAGVYKQPVDRFVTFAVVTDDKWKLKTVVSLFKMDAPFYEEAKDIAVSQNKEHGKFKLDGNHWAYDIKPMASGYRLIFLDISSQQSILANLIYTFLAVALVMLVLIYLISRFFANRSIKPVRDAFEKQKQFIADASHELKTPLAVIDTNVDVLLSNSSDTIENQSKWLQYIKSASIRMAKLTNDLLYLTQVDHSDRKTIFTDFDVSETVQNAILTMEAIIYEHDLSLHYDIEPGLVTHGNGEDIKEVVMILLDNALKYTNAKGSVDISLKRRHNEIVFAVSNTGEGIPEDQLDRIFDRFYRVDKSRSRSLGGYGLGLAIAKAIVEQHKGRIYAKSVMNEKTTFYAELPVSAG